MPIVNDKKNTCCHFTNRKQIKLRSKYHVTSDNCAATLVTVEPDDIIAVCFTIFMNGYVRLVKCTKYFRRLCIRYYVFSTSARQHSQPHGDPSIVVRTSTFILIIIDYCRHHLTWARISIPCRKQNADNMRSVYCFVLNLNATPICFDSN